MLSLFYFVLLILLVVCFAWLVRSVTSVAISLVAGALMLLVVFYFFTGGGPLEPYLSPVSQAVRWPVDIFLGLLGITGR